MTGGPILLMLLCIPLMVPFSPPLYFLDWIKDKLGIPWLSPYAEGSWMVFLVAEAIWCIPLAYFWHRMGWSWWIPGLWLGALVLLLLAGRYC